MSISSKNCNKTQLSRKP